MYPQTEYEMSTVDLQKLLDASRPVPCIMIGGCAPATPQENANRAWARLGKKMGFDPMTVRPIPGKGQRWFTAIPAETPEQKAERLAQEAEAKRAEAIKALEDEIKERQERLETLRNEDAEQGGGKGEWRDIT